MGFTKKSAEVFFNKIKENNIDLLIDVRLNNTSQLAGFSKGKDLSFFLDKICNCDFLHEKKFSPTKEILNGYKKGIISWEEYEIEYNHLLEKRDIVNYFDNRYGDMKNILLLCSEPESENCHRRLLGEKISNELGVELIHL
jgi:uncharacterized protein (DUF488 family)